MPRIARPTKGAAPAKAAAKPAAAPAKAAAKAPAKAPAKAAAAAAPAKRPAAAAPAAKAPAKAPAKPAVPAPVEPEEEVVQDVEATEVEESESAEDAPAEEEQLEEPKALAAPAHASSRAITAPSYIPKGGDLAKRGKENIAPEDLGIPRMSLLQALSPEVTDVARGPDEGYKPGLYYYKNADLIMGEEFSFVVLKYQKDFIWWKPRKDGGGIVARMTPAQYAAGEFPEGTSPDDFEFKDGNPPKVTTHMNFLVLEYDPASDTLDPNEIGPFVFSCQKTTMAAGKHLCRLLMSKPTASYAAVYTTRAKQTTNKLGTFFIHDISPESIEGDEASGWLRSAESYAAAEELWERFGSKEVKARYDDEAAPDEDNADTSAAGAGAAEGDY